MRTHTQCLAGPERLATPPGRAGARRRWPRRLACGSPAALPHSVACSWCARRALRMHNACMRNAPRACEMCIPKRRACNCNPRTDPKLPNLKPHGSAELLRVRPCRTLPALAARCRAGQRSGRRARALKVRSRPGPGVRLRLGSRPPAAQEDLVEQRLLGLVLRLFLRPRHRCWQCRPALPCTELDHCARPPQAARARSSASVRGREPAGCGPVRVQRRPRKGAPA